MCFVCLCVSVCVLVCDGRAGGGTVCLCVFGGRGVGGVGLVGGWVVVRVGGWV